jgi:hypothetical protein
MARCPAHEDRNPSLSITEATDGKVLLRCHAGCSQEAVIAALRARGLWPERTRSLEPEPIIRRYEIRNLDGSLVASHERKDYPDGRKTFTWRDPSGKPGLGGRPVAELPLYRTEKLRDLPPGSPVVVCEGEKATEAVEAMGLAAVGTVTGANGCPVPEVLEVLRPFRVFLWPDNDPAGQRHMERVAEVLGQVGVTPLLLRWPEAPEKGDAYDFRQRYGAEAKAKLQGLLEAAEPWEPKPQPEPLSPNDRFEGLEGGGEVAPGFPRYRVKDGQTLMAKVEGRGEARAVHYVELANFVAMIKRVISATDGQDTETVFELEGVLAPAKPFHGVRVKASEFGSMRWVLPCLGPDANVAPGQAAKDCLRAAIQAFSKGRYTSATVYRHLGWTRLEGVGWVYLHAGGGIGPQGAVEGVEMGLDRVLAAFELPSPPQGEEERACIREALALVDLAPERITVPLLLYTLTCPLGQVDFTCYLTGATGTFKTSTALVFQAFQGYKGRTPPAGWESTSNALEGLAFAAKDALLLIDDDAPGSNHHERRTQDAVVARVLRSQGNATGRARMRSDGSTTYDRPPRGGLLATGEDLPSVHSLRARCLFLEVQSGDIRRDALTAAQRKAREGVYAKAFAAWVRWLAADLERRQKWLTERVEELRESFQASHARTAQHAARLLATWELFREFAASRGVELGDLPQRVHRALHEVVEGQAAIQRDADPVLRFFELLGELLGSGQVHLLSREHPQQPPEHPERWGWKLDAAGSLRPGGVHIGWVDRTFAYLLPTATYAALWKHAGAVGLPLPSERVLWKRLAERGAIETHEESGELRTKVKLQVAGSRQRVVCVPLNNLEGGYQKIPGHPGHPEEDAVANGVFPCPGKADCPGKLPGHFGNHTGGPGAPDAGAPLASGAHQNDRGTENTPEMPVTTASRPGCPERPGNSDIPPSRVAQASEDAQSTQAPADGFQLALPWNGSGGGNGAGGGGGAAAPWPHEAQAEGEAPGEEEEWCEWVL